MTFLPQIILPWPPRALSPNGRAHWSVKYRAGIRQRADAQAIALAAGWRRLSVAPTEIRLRLSFCPPSRRRFDLDNALASIKPALDQLALILDVDDTLFAPALVRGEMRKNGGVIVLAEVGHGVH